MAFERALLKAQVQRVAIRDQYGGQPRVLVLLLDVVTEVRDTVVKSVICELQVRGDNRKLEPRRWVLLRCEVLRCDQVEGPVRLPVYVQVPGP